MSGGWTIQDGRAVYLTAEGDGVEVGEVYDPRTPLRLRYAAASSLHALILAAAAGGGAEGHREAEATADLDRLGAVAPPVDDGYAPAWVQSVTLDAILDQRAKGWPDFHPEEFCHRCGQRNPVWWTDAEPWQAATESRERGVVDILCPSCFAALHPRRVHLRIEVERPSEPTGGRSDG